MYHHFKIKFQSILYSLGVFKHQRILILQRFREILSVECLVERLIQFTVRAGAGYCVGQPVMLDRCDAD